MANKDKKNNSNFKQALDEIMQGKLTTEKPKTEKEIKDDISKAVQQISESKSKDENVETVIGGGVVIEGNVKTAVKLVIRGEVTGNIVSSADVVITGKVGGSIQGNNIIVEESEIRDTIIATSQVKISEKSIVNGDIKAGSVINEGVVNGNINARTVTLSETSKTIGDISCTSVRISEGACLKGKLETV